MRLPTQLPNNQADSNALGEFYNTHAMKQWFDMAMIVENHPNQMRKALVLNVNYNPALEMKEILAFTHKYTLGLEIISKQNA